MEINSIKDLIDALEGLGEPEEGHTRFFRGHSNAREYKLEPSIYREDNKYYYNEDNIIRDAIVNNPSEFSDKDTLFNTLVKLQHYGYPTRLLDLTTNALVSIYFSVRNNDKYDGEIIIFDIPNEDIKYFDSDTVSVLSALSLRKHNFSTNTHIITLKAKVLCEKANFLYKINKNFNLTNDCLDLKNEIEKHFKSELDLPYDEELIEKFEREIQDADLGTSDDLVEEVYQNRLKEIEEISYIQAFNNTPEISKLLHDIRKDKPSFRSLINHNDLEKVICVKPQLNNNRIIRQQGCFLLLGIDKIK